MDTISEASGVSPHFVCNRFCNGNASKALLSSRETELTRGNAVSAEVAFGLAARKATSVNKTSSSKRIPFQVAEERLSVCLRFYSYATGHDISK